MKRPASDKYSLTISPGVYDVQGFGEVDLRSLTLEKAEMLYKKGFPYLELKPKASKKKGPEVKKIEKNKKQ